jgi:hypothetical protein
MMGPDVALQVVGAWVLVFLIRTVRADVTWRGVDQAMPNHLILPLEASTSGAAWTIFDGTEVIPLVGMHIHMAVQ